MTISVSGWNATQVAVSMGFEVTLLDRDINKLREAGVPVTAVRFQGIIHDFVMLNALRGTHAAEAAITMATTVLREALASA